MMGVLYSVIGGNLSLIGHSAGGWLARVYMEEFGLSHISFLLTLGTPHLYVFEFVGIHLEPEKYSRKKKK